MKTNIDEPLSTMNLALLAEYGAQELSKYRRKETSDDRYCLEILRRAVLQRDHHAWLILEQLLSENVYLWLARNPYRTAALRHETDKNYVNDAFRRFWQAVHEKQLEFATLASALSYLHLCLNCAIMDSLRAYARPREERIPDYGHPDEPLIEDSYHEDELWDVLKHILPGAREKRVAFLLFHCNLKPREIMRYYPHEFRSESEIYRLKRNIMERILRNVETIRWKLGGA